MIMANARALAGGTVLVLAGALLAVAPSFSVIAEEAALQAAKYDLARPYIGGPLPDAEKLIPPAPALGSAMDAGDNTANEHYLELAGGPRWHMAARDADLSKGWIARAFSCAAGRVISDADTPALAQLLRRTSTDFGFSTSGVKALYQRSRPFMVNGGPTCTPDDETGLRGNGSYPSGHSAIGYGTALVLASVLPARVVPLLDRGREYGLSRAVCNVHWDSDVEQGRVVAVATFARLVANDEFQRDLVAARKEITALEAVAPDPSQCTADTAAIAAGS